MPSSKKGLVFSLMGRYRQPMTDAESRNWLGELKSVYFWELLSLEKLCSCSYNCAVTYSRNKSDFGLIQSPLRTLGQRV